MSTIEPVRRYGRRRRRGATASRAPSAARLVHHQYKLPVMRGEQDTWDQSCLTRASSADLRVRFVWRRVLLDSDRGRNVRTAAEHPLDPAF